MAGTYLERVGGLWWEEGKLGSDLGRTGRATEQATNLTQTQPHPVHSDETWSGLGSMCGPISVLGLRAWLSRVSSALLLTRAQQAP